MSGRRSLAFAVALVVGATIRLSVVGVRVPAVDDSWRAWSYHAATGGVARMYGPRGHTVAFGGVDAPVVYPPIALAELGIVGRIYTWIRPGFPDDRGLTIAIKSAIAVFESALTVLLFVAVERLAGPSRAAIAAAAYWINPATLAAASLGYVDAFVALPATAAVFAASGGHSLAAGALAAAAALTKPQGLFVTPVVALALWNAGDSDPVASMRTSSSGRKSRSLVKLATAALGGAAVCAVVAAPLAAAGTAYFMVRSVAVLAGHDMLSALAFNAWWIVSYLFAAATAAHGFGAALAAEPYIVTHATAIEHGFPHPRIVAIALVGAACTWTLAIARDRRDLAAHTAVAAFIVVAYFILSVQVHENHFYLALPLMATAAALRSEFRGPAAAFSVTFALNLLLTYGWAGHELPSTHVPLLAIDATVIVAIVNCGLFVWFGRRLRQLCQETATAQESVAGALGRR